MLRNFQGEQNRTEKEKGNILVPVTSNDFYSAVILMQQSIIDLSETVVKVIVLWSSLIEIYNIYYL